MCFSVVFSVFAYHDNGETFSDFNYREEMSETSNEKISFIGGDIRMIYAAEHFLREGNHVFLYGFEKAEKRQDGMIFSDDIDFVLEGADKIVFPVPMSRDKESVVAPFSENKIYAEDVLSKISEKTKIYGGMVGTGIYKREIYDYAARDDFSIRNAVPTAEAAMMLAIKETSMTIFKMRAAVIGFGRVGRVLSKSLVSLGADVSVFAGRAESKAIGDTYFCETFDFADFKNNANKFDCVFNTVPHTVLFGDSIAALKPDTPVIELASSLGGIDREAAKSIGINIVDAPSLPGRVTPKTAGMIIYKTLSEMS